MLILRRVLQALVILFVLIQFVPYGRKHTNPPTLGEPAWDAPRTRELFDRACADCHSNRTVWPWYSHVAPVSWLVWHDVEEARRRFNVSEWGRARNKGDEAAYQVQQDFMPDPNYLKMHPTARLNATEKAELVKGLRATFPEKPEAGDAGDETPAGDAAGDSAATR